MRSGKKKMTKSTFFFFFFFFFFFCIFILRWLFLNYFFSQSPLFFFFFFFTFKGIVFLKLQTIKNNLVIQNHVNNCQKYNWGRGRKGMSFISLVILSFVKMEIVLQKKKNNELFMSSNNFWKIHYISFFFFSAFCHSNWEIFEKWYSEYLDDYYFSTGDGFLYH